MFLPKGAAFRVITGTDGLSRKSRSAALPTALKRLNMAIAIDTISIYGVSNHFSNIILHKTIFITGSTGYIGSRLVASLMQRNHSVRELVRRNYSVTRPNIVIGNALDSRTYESSVAGCDTFVHLVGVSHPNPFKKEKFRAIDYVSLHEAIIAAKKAKIEHFIYLSVAHPAPIMKEYIAVRKECEEIIIDSGLNATILRPWYIIGPGHRWPLVLMPLYKFFGLLPSTRLTVKRLGLMTIGEMINALLYVIEHPANGVRILDVEEMKNLYD